MIKRVKINNFRGLNFEDELNKFNIIIGPNSSGKTSFLEALFLSLIFSSNYNLTDLNLLVDYALSSRGDIYSAFGDLTDSEVYIDDLNVSFKKKNMYEVYVKVDNTTVGLIKLERAQYTQRDITSSILTPYIEVEENEIKKIDKNVVYLSTRFDYYDIPERIVVTAKRKGFASSFEVLMDEYSQYKLFYGNLPVYVIGRGKLKEGLIKDSLNFADLLLVDEIEDSLHPDLVSDIFKKMKDSNSQVIMTTHTDEVLKLAIKILPEKELTIFHFASPKKHKKYTPSDLSSYEYPLSWAGYV